MDQTARNRGLAAARGRSVVSPTSLASAPLLRADPPASSVPQEGGSRIKSGMTVLGTPDFRSGAAPRRRCGGDGDDGARGFGLDQPGPELRAFHRPCDEEALGGVAS